ncbi:hypothetical protein BD310DRAFT_941932, partial [Dichomitus squalens]
MRRSSAAMLVASVSCPTCYVTCVRVPMRHGVGLHMLLSPAWFVAIQILYARLQGPWSLHSFPPALRVCASMMRWGSEMCLTPGPRKSAAVTSSNGSGFLSISVSRVLALVNCLTPGVISPSPIS